MNRPEADANHGSILITSAKDAGITDAALCEFYAQNWNRPIALQREDFFHWQFSAAPESGNGNHSVVATRGDKVIAVLGATPRSFRFAGHEFKAAELTTWIVAEEARGLGLGSRILDHLQNEFDVLTGAGITAQALPLYLKAGFTFQAQIPRFFYVTDFDAIKTFASPKPSAIAAVKKRQLMGETPQNLSATKCNPKDIGQLAQNIPSLVGLNTRDANYMEWRYDQHPVFQYEAFLIGANSQRQTGVVLREDAVDGASFLHLADVTGDPDNFSEAIAFAENEAQRRGCAFVDVSTTLGTLNAVLRSRGWNSSVDDQFIELPSLFYPVEFRRPPTTSIVFWSRERKGDLYDFGKLHFTKGDLDLDRPTLAFYEKHGL